MRREVVAVLIIVCGVFVGAFACYHYSGRDVQADEQVAGRAMAAAPPASSVAAVPASLRALEETEKAAGYLSPLDIVADADGGKLYVAEATASRIAVVDAGSGTVSSNIPLPANPNGLALSADGSTLYVTAGDPGGQLLRVDVSTGEVSGKLAMGHTPMAPVLSPDGSTVYVCNRFDGDVSVVDLGSMAAKARVAMLREPVAAGVTPDGSKLFVANHLPTGAADSGYISAAVSVIDTATAEVVRNIELPNGSTGLRGLCVSPDGKHAYVTHILARYQVPTTQLERGWMNTNALTVIDAEKGEYVTSVLLDNIDLGAANPWGVTCTADGKYICVAQAGTHEVSVIDREAMHEKLQQAAAGDKVTEVTSSAQDVPNDLSFLAGGVRRRLELAGNGPRGIATIGSRIYAAEYFSASVGLADADPDVYHEPHSISLGEEPPMTAVRRGERFFNDGDFCFQNWQSCGSCHPDTRMDGLNWDLLNDGIGNPKNTKSMLLSHRTPPVMITGVRPDAETAVRAGMRFIQFAVRPEEDAEAIDAYLKSLRPVPSPSLVDGELSESARRGKKVFEEAACARCHPAPLFTDQKPYDVGTGIGREEGTEFDTPSCVEAWRTAPYLNSGQAATLHEMLTRLNKDDTHGKTSGLSERELEDLINYVLSL